MEKLQTVEQYDALKNEGKHIFLFSATWCGDCRVIEPIMPEIETKFPDFTFIYVDRDEFIDVCAANDVFGIPSFIAYDNGKELGRFVSKDRKTQEQIEEFIQSL
ncbi:thioredoxin family protein [Peribacillus castrilensis]|jgi:thiol-disulfide isomerase/thioredoxin|uniref:Thioredoxin n=2 Tax=Peribacillus TaxID=2675229 RepID=A0A9X8ZIM5_9BACI|nr:MULTISPECIES: thioredoxin family protein [Bacillaceae]KOR80038.1 thioredoxin [Bacillus sp. FJAT-21352]KOR86279.1 thioredoxin [Bacillus sp. FJAT-22058]KRF54564.1 thioredoxin [Bacillus sp. Soil745]MBT2601636.1 thioredoxin family protein [Bacillus sp. ISL-53]MCD1161962.1 thioredoxin family protein [Peribacillus castrilensis]MCP1093318.1 thioredoxin family protein [Bacillaceae bacterium OS4b]MDP9739687.1 thiol-disulfide isomerase/thioredoxin [Bacillus sp. B2I3]PEF37970.1 thioredoxin [Bacillu